MACGAIGCLVGGYLSKYIGNRYVAIGSLSISGFSCLVFALGWRFYLRGSYWFYLRSGEHLLLQTHRNSLRFPPNLVHPKKLVRH